MEGPNIVSREEWGAAEPRGMLYRMQSYDGFVVHHSVGSQPRNSGDGAETVRRIQRFHQDRRGWVDVGYNFLIDGGGRIYQGRPEVDGDLAIGSHTYRHNSGLVGICLLGCFHPPEPGCDDAPTEEQVDSLVVLCRHSMVRFCMRAPSLGGHRDHRSTACPGDRLYERLDEIRDAIAGDYRVTLERPAAPT